MDDLMMGLGSPSENGGAQQHSMPSAQGMYDPSAGAPASAPVSTADDINSALDQMNNAFGHLGNKSVQQPDAAPQPAVQPQQPVGQYGQQSAVQAQQPMDGQPQQEPPKVNDMGYSSDDYRYDPRRMNYGQRASDRTAPQGGYGQQGSYGQQPPVNRAPQNSYGSQPAGYGAPQNNYGGQQNNYGQQSSGYGGQQNGYGQSASGYSSDDYKYDPYKNYNSSDSFTTRAASSETDFTALLKGIAGALVGAIPGMLLMILVARFGFIASLCGAVMAACIFFGYKFMTKNSWLTAKTGLLVCGIVMVIAVYFSVRISWTSALVDVMNEAISLTRDWLGEYDTYGYTDDYYKGLLGGDTTPTFGNCWDNFGKILAEAGLKGRFYASLAENYLFAGLGAFGAFAKFGRNNF